MSQISVKIVSLVNCPLTKGSHANTKRAKDNANTSYPPNKQISLTFKHKPVSRNGETPSVSAFLPGFPPLLSIHCTSPRRVTYCEL